MNTLSITYAYTHQLSFATEYKFTKCKKCVNSKTGRELKKRYVSRCLGYSIRGKFYSLTRLRPFLEIARTTESPF